MRLPRTLATLPRNLELREQFSAFGSHFILNLSLFGVLFAASAILNLKEFAYLTLANNYIMIIAMLFDFGLNSAALKLSIEQNRNHFVYVNLALKGGLFFFSVIVLTAAVASKGLVTEVTIFCCSAGLTFWYAMRCVEQFDRRFKRYAALNLSLAASRILLGGGALLTKSWLWLVLALHLGALLPICAKTVYGLFRRRAVLQRSFGCDTIRPLFRIAPAFFLAAAFFSAIPAITQTAIYLIGDEAATGAFGMVILIIGPISLLSNTLRIYLQPQIIQKNFAAVDVFSLGPGSLHATVAAYASVLLICLWPVSFLLEWIYQNRFPQIGLYILVYGTANCVADAVGIYNIRALRGELIWIGLTVNVVRAGLIALPLLIPQGDALSIVIWSAFVLAAGEVVLFWLLAIASRTYQGTLDHQKQGEDAPEQ